MNFLNKLSEVIKPLSQLKNPAAHVQNPGDELSLRVTKTGRKVAKLKTGNVKRSATKYKNGTLVETISYK